MRRKDKARHRLAYPPYEFCTTSFSGAAHTSHRLERFAATTADAAVYAASRRHSGRYSTVSGRLFAYFASVKATTPNPPSLNVEVSTITTRAGLEPVAKSMISNFPPTASGKLI